jgi:hypothetical protein
MSIEEVDRILNNINQMKWDEKYSNLGIGFYAGTSMSVASEVFYSQNLGTWMGKNGKFYNQSWGGNQYTGGQYKFAKGISDKLSIAGKVAGAAGIVNTVVDYAKGSVDGYQATLDLVSGAYSTYGGLVGAAWGVGWEAGRYVTQQSGYQKAKFQVFYNWWQLQYGKPSYENRYMWNYFFENYKP